MLLFRSEEHVGRWRAGRTGGRTIGIAMLNDLAVAWWGDRLDPAWRPRDRDANQAILDQVGLDGPFWTLPETTDPGRPRGRTVE